VYSKQKWIKSLRGSLIITNSEVIYIKDVADISGIYKFVHSSYLYTELYANLEGIAYKSHQDGVSKKKLKTTTLTISDNVIIIKISNNNIALLLLDPSELVRHAAEDWHRAKNKVSWHQYNLLYYSLEVF